MKHVKCTNRERFERFFSNFIEHPAVQPLKAVPQHKNSTTYAHSVAVTRKAYDIAEKLHWNVDPQCLVRGAMLHDYYLYDTRTMPWSDYRHSLVHPKLAVANAEGHFNLTRREKNVILSHMWPIPGAPLPRSREAWLVCLADKICAWREIRGYGETVGSRQ